MAWIATSTRPFGRLCLAARRMVERGVRFVQIFHGGGGGGAWDAHAGIRANHGQLSSQVDLPIAGLLKDLKRRGMLDETIVVWGTEFGRSPGAQADGRDHHPQGFCAWLAGGGIKGGVVHGATDEIGFHAVEDRHYVTDIHATVLHQLGLDPQQARGPRPQAAGDRLRPADPPDHRLIINRLVRQGPEIANEIGRNRRRKGSLAHDDANHFFGRIVVP